jgi:hypothetical protein
MGQGHPTGLTPNLLKLFEARPPLAHKPPVEKRKLPAYTGKRSINCYPPARAEAWVLISLISGEISAFIIL